MWWPEGCGLTTVVNARQTCTRALGCPRVGAGLGPEAVIKAGASALGPSAGCRLGAGREEHDFLFYLGSRHYTCRSVHLGSRPCSTTQREVTGLNHSAVRRGQLHAKLQSGTDAPVWHLDLIQAFKGLPEFPRPAHLSGF